MNEPLGDDAKYVLDNGIKVYGLKVTGSSDEIYKLLEDINFRFANVEKVDFWYWINKTIKFFDKYLYGT